jgi:hypothetical protein
MVGVLRANLCPGAFVATKFNKLIFGCQPDNILLNYKEHLSLLALCEQNGWLAGWLAGGEYRKVY